MRNFIFLIFLGTSLSACIPDSRIDASDDNSIKKSIANVKSSLDVQQLKEFDEAITLLTFSEIQGMGNIFALAGSNPEHLKKNLFQTLHGKTAQEVIDLARQKKAEIKKKQLISIQEELAVLQKAQIDSEKAKNVLEKIEITNPKFYWPEDAFISNPMIDFNITNKMDVPIAKGFFHGVVASPGRTIPWISEDFNYEFRGGLEPNETQNLQLAPNMFSGWSVPETKDRKDLVMTIDIINAEDADGKMIAVQFGENEQKRMEALLQEEQKLILDLQ